MDFESVTLFIWQINRFVQYLTQRLGVSCIQIDPYFDTDKVIFLHIDMQKLCEIRPYLFVKYRSARIIFFLFIAVRSRTGSSK